MVALFIVIRQSGGIDTIIEIKTAKDLAIPS